MLNGKKTYIGIAIAALAFILNRFGLGGEAEAAQIVTMGAELFGLLVAVYGRAVAKPE